MTVKLAHVRFEGQSGLGLSDGVRSAYDAKRTPAALRLYAVVNYEQAVEPFLKTDRLSDSERAMLMGGACAKVYRWSPKKG